MHKTVGALYPLVEQVAHIIRAWLVDQYTIPRFVKSYDCPVPRSAQLYKRGTLLSSSGIATSAIAGLISRSCAPSSEKPSSRPKRHFAMLACSHGLCSLRTSTNSSRVVSVWSELPSSILASRRACEDRQSQKKKCCDDPIIWT
jgi:hypothetical protein